MTIEDFLIFFNGIYCDYDGAYGDQCFDLANCYSRWIGGQRFSGANAYEIFSQAGDFYEQISNSPSAIPIAGDIVVWSGDYNGGPGHVGISTGKGDVNSFEVLEQNDPLNSNCHLKVYNYSHVLGWLHPKATPLPSPIVPEFNDQTKIPKELLGEDQNLEIQQIRGLLLDGKRDNFDLANCRKENEKLENYLAECQQKLSATTPISPPKPLKTALGRFFYQLAMNIG